MITDRSGNGNSLAARHGPFYGKKGGRRVWFSLYKNDDILIVSVYPEDARKFAMEILRVADECEKL